MLIHPLSAVCLCLLTAPAAAQVWQPLITGSVTDSTGRPIPMVLVHAPGTPYATRTNPDGLFSFDSLPSGYLTVRAELIGYHADQRDSVRVETREPLVLDFRLSANPDPALARLLAPAAKASKHCWVDSPVQAVTDTVAGRRPAVVVVASCRNKYLASPPRPGEFLFPRSGHLMVRDHRGWNRLLQRYWQADSTGAPPIAEPDWTLGSLLVLSVQASGGCGWTQSLHVVGGNSRSMTLELRTDDVAPCQMLVRDVYLLRVTQPGIEVRVREAAGHGRIGLAHDLSLQPIGHVPPVLPRPSR